MQLQSAHAKAQIHGSLRATERDAAYAGHRMTMNSESADDHAAVTGGMDWGVGSFVFEAAFEKLATALRWMFWGMLLQVFGAAAAGAPLAAIMLGIPGLSPKLVLPGIVAILVGGIVLLIGEQKCLHLELPLGMTRSLPGHNWLRAAYWCHLGSWLLRMARRFFDRRLVSVVLLPMQLAGFAFLLLFLRKMADVLARRDFERDVVELRHAGGGSVFEAGNDERASSWRWSSISRTAGGFVSGCDGCLCHLAGPDGSGGGGVREILGAGREPGTDRR
jgi:hypothetical protein